MAKPMGQERGTGHSAEVAAVVRTRDTGTLPYECYIDSRNAQCLVFERYRDSQALLDHFENLGETMAALFRTCSASGRSVARLAGNS
jgi:quinol monooxygenase YgiN